MSDAAFDALEDTGRRLVTLSRASRSFAALRDGSATVALYRDWLAQTALYCAVTGEVLVTAAESLRRAGDPLSGWARDFADHGAEEGEENGVILQDLAILGVRGGETAPIPPVAAYLAMVRTMASDERWAVGLFGLVRVLELLARDCAGVIHENLSRSAFPEIRGALRFLEAHRDEEEHLARTETVIRSVPPEYDPTLIWCGRMACQIYDGLLAHLDARRH